jgi:hypothetical protein
MKKAATVVAALGLLAASAWAADAGYVKGVEEWRAQSEARLRKDNGWLTLAGRFPMKPGENTFGTAKDNDVVFPEGLGAAHMGTITVAPKRVEVKLAPGVTMTQEGIPMTDKVMGFDPENPDWVAIGRAAFHVIERDGNYILRLADNQSEVRKHFVGRVWYPVKNGYRVPAKFVPYDPPRKIEIVDVIGEVSQEPVPGYVEFKLDGKPQRLDVVGEDEGLFFVFRDATAGRTTYPPGRFLYVEKKPKAGETFMLDLNRAYNPPCAFSAFTTCPLPPRQNVLKASVEAGEKYPPRKKS